MKKIFRVAGKIALFISSTTVMALGLVTGVILALDLVYKHTHEYYN